MKKELLEMVNELVKTNDVTYFVDGNIVNVTLNDFDSFDEDYEELLRDYVNVDLVAKMTSFLFDNALSVSNDYQKTFTFNDFTVVLDYASDEI